MKIIILYFILLFAFAEESPNAKTRTVVYKDSSELLNVVKSKLYTTVELTNVCVESDRIILFQLPEESRDKVLSISSGLSFSVTIEPSALFSTFVGEHQDFVKKSIGLLLASSSVSEFEPFRLYNSLLYLHRNQVDLSNVNTVFLQIDKKESVYDSKIFDLYSTAIYSVLGDHLHVQALSPSCFHQFLFITPAFPPIEDLINQLDSIYLKKLVYKTKPQYPIPRRPFNILCNFRREIPKWKDENPVRDYFDRIERTKRQLSFVTLGEMSTKKIVRVLKNTDIFVTTYGVDSLFLVFMVPYSVIIEVQPDYFHDSTTSVLAFASDIYPIILSDVNRPIPRECPVVNELVKSETGECRAILKNREIEFDIKSMTQAIYQARYYLVNNKMKVVKF